MLTGKSKSKQPARSRLLCSASNLVVPRSTPTHSPGPQVKPTSRLKFIRVHRLARLLGVDQSTIWRWRRDGILPEPIKIGGIVGWPENQLLDLLAKHHVSKTGA